MSDELLFTLNFSIILKSSLTSQCANIVNDNVSKKKRLIYKYTFCLVFKVNVKF